MDYWSPPFTLITAVTGTVRYDTETRGYIAYCPELDLYTAGLSPAAARQALVSAVALYMRTCRAQRGKVRVT